MELHPEVKPIFRNDITESRSVARITTPYFTKYEYVTLLAARAQQIADGSKPLVSLDGLRTSAPNFLDLVVKREIEQRKLPYIIRRRLPNGVSEYWNVQELELTW